MSHGHQERPTGSKFKAEMRSVSIHDIGPARGQVGQIRHGTEVGDSSPKDICGRLTHHSHRLVMFLAQGAQLPCPKREFHRRLERFAGEATPSASAMVTTSNVVA
jgi:hypothetical protein